MPRKPKPALRPAHPVDTDPTAIAAAELTRQLPHLVKLAVAGAKKGKPTVLRAVRGIVRDLQKAAAEAGSRHKREAKVWNQLEQAGPLTTTEADVVLGLLNDWRVTVRLSQRSAMEAGYKGNNFDAICHPPSSGPDPLTMQNPPDIRDWLDSPANPPRPPDTTDPKVSK